jgi:NADPH2:quinone reductase
MMADRRRTSLDVAGVGTSLAYGYARQGGVEVLERREIGLRPPEAGEVQIALYRSGVNPTDVKARSGANGVQLQRGAVQVPHHDGAGVVIAVGPDVTRFAVGQRVWTHRAAYQRSDGTAQQFITLAESRVAELPDNASFELGAALGVPFLTAHRLLTLHQDGPRRLAPAALAGRVVLVAGGAGAVGNAAIQLATWAGATVITTVSTEAKAALASAAGAHHVVNYRESDVVRAVREVARDGVDVIVEVSPAVNAQIDLAVLATGGVVGVYATDGGAQVQLPIMDLMWLSASIGFVILYTMSPDHLAHGVSAVVEAVSAGAIRVGESVGLPIRTYAMADIAAAHTAVENSIVGKVQLEIDRPADLYE